MGRAKPCKQLVRDELGEDHAMRVATEHPFGDGAQDDGAAARGEKARRHVELKPQEKGPPRVVEPRRDIDDVGDAEAANEGLDVPKDGGGGKLQASPRLEQDVAA